MERKEITGDSPQNGTPIIDDPRIARNGLISLRNLGPCSLTIMPLDTSGFSISSGYLTLVPHQFLPSYRPPLGTAKIIAIPFPLNDKPPKFGCRPTLEYIVPSI
jgi:hypothetical protein